jgi:hypothetical protein
MATPAFDRRKDKAVVDALRQVCRQLTEKNGGRWPPGA